MKTQAQSSAELRQLSTLIETMSVAMLTTLDDHGRLESRPMSPLEMDDSGAIWFFTDLRSAKAEHLAVLNLAFVDSKDQTYVSVSGRGELHTERADIERLWTEFARPWFPDGVDSPNLALLKAIPETAEYWDAPNSKMVRMLAMAVSIVARKPVGTGEHVTLARLTPGAADASVATTDPAYR